MMKKLLALNALMVLACCIATIGNAMAGEKIKLRAHNYLTKWEQVEVGDEEGHIVAVYEGVAIVTFFQWKGPADWAVRGERGLLDSNPKTGFSSGHGYGTDTDKDGDKMYYTWEGKQVEGSWSGEYTYVKGTGKYEGIKGKGTWTAFFVSPKQWISDLEAEVEFPQR
jgi:hypothetical protein